MKIKNNRIHYLFAVLLYLICFGWSYFYVAVEKYKYFGFGDGTFNSISILIIALCVFIPASIMPLGSVRASAYLNTILFFLIYIPSIFIINDNNILYNVDSYFLSFVLLLCFIFHIISSRIPLAHFKNINIKFKWLHPNYIVYALVLPLSILIFVKVSSNFSIIGILDVYDKRDKLKELNLGIIVYLIQWLSNFILPIVIARSIVMKQRKILYLGLLCYVFMFFTLGAKFYLLAVGYFILSYYYILSLNKKNVFIPILFSGLLIFPALLIGEHLVLIRPVYEGVINMRVFLIQGLGTAVYSDFFLSNPITYFSHISIINSLVQYPYSLGISEVLNEKYGLGNYNAPYFVSDGFSSLQYFGMLIMSIIVSCYFYILDLVTKNHDYKTVILSLSVFIVSFANVSFATSLVTLGGLLFLLYYVFTPQIKVS
jgi:hypothetical protein